MAQVAIQQGRLRRRADFRPHCRPAGAPAVPVFRQTQSGGGRQESQCSRSAKSISAVLWRGSCGRLCISSFWRLPAFGQCLRSMGLDLSDWTTRLPANCRLLSARTGSRGGFAGAGSGEEVVRLQLVDDRPQQGAESAPQNLYPDADEDEGRQANQDVHRRVTERLLDPFGGR